MARDQIPGVVDVDWRKLPGALAVVLDEDHLADALEYVQHAALAEGHIEPADMARPFSADEARAALEMLPELMSSQGARAASQHVFDVYIEMYMPGTN